LGTLGDDLTRFEDISALEGGDDFTGGGRGKKRKQPKGKKKGKLGERHTDSSEILTSSVFSQDSRN